MIFRSPFPDIPIPNDPLTPTVLRHAVQRADKPALIDGASGRTLTYGQLAQGIRRTATGLARRGFQKGDVFATYVPNALEYAIAFHAVASRGGIIMPINPMSTADELAHRFRDAKATYVLSSAETLDRTREAARHSCVREIFVLGKSSEATSFDSLLGDEECSGSDVAIDPNEDLVALLYSSGTSGLPKGVMLTHRNLVAGLHLLLAGDGIGCDEVVLGVLPFFHMVGLGVMNLVLAQGATLVVPPRYELPSFLQTLQDYAVSRAYLAPPIIVSLAKQAIVDDYDLSRLRVIHSGAAPLSETIARGCLARLGCPIQQSYALTEGYPAMRMGSADPEMRRVASVGRCLPNTECRVVDAESRADLGPGQAGEIWLRGPQVMKGYLNAPDATARTIDSEGWLRTGDIGYADEKGFFTIVDRLKELIKYKGYQVAPAELEDLLLSHPAVADAAVIPSPDEEAGEIPKAFVVLRGEATPDELMAFVAARVAPYKKVRQIEFITQIPKSPSGKILRRVLVERERDAVLSVA